MRYLDRADAGRQLAARLNGFKGREHTLVLGLPRGGMVVAAEFARSLQVPVDALLARKLGVPGNEEQAFGAVAAENGVYLEQEIIRVLGVTQAQVTSAIDRTRGELRRRAELYRNHRNALPVRGETVLLVDDGAATGASLIAGLQALKKMRPAQLIVALPVAPEPACTLLERYVDLLVVLQRPRDFFAVGQYYLDFHQVSDDEVLRLLQASDDRVRAQSTAKG
jgi:putative phosphoribosyl transferase